jgi:hypothetical protein
MNSFDNLFFVLSNKRLINSTGVDLTHDELLKLWEFYNLFTGSVYSRLIMRGESNENLGRQFHADTHNLFLLAERLFLTGEKARACWANDWFVDPDDTSRENFERICESLFHYLHDGARGKGKRADRIRAFCERNVGFTKALENIPQIVKEYVKLDHSDRRTANLHYLSLSHTINSLEYRRASGFISTTTDTQVAEQFTEDAMIYGWVPRTTDTVCCLGRTIDNVVVGNSKTLKQMGLPYPDTPVYPDQKEISIRCGLLPHFIIGFTAGNDFYVNPAIFPAIDKMHELTSFRALSRYRRHLQQWGLEVNQEGFEDFIRQTGFSRYFTFDGDEYRIHTVDAH